MHSLRTAIAVFAATAAFVLPTVAAAATPSAPSTAAASVATDGTPWG